MGSSLVHAEWDWAHNTQSATVGLFDTNKTVHSSHRLCTVHTDWDQSTHSHRVGLSLVHKKWAWDRPIPHRVPEWDCVHTDCALDLAHR